jgi:hypothetical protein
MYFPLRNWLLASNGRRGAQAEAAAVEERI